MAKKQENLFRRLTRLFRSGPVVKKKIKTMDTAMAVADKTKSSGTLLFQKSISPTYATITANAYNLSERLMRYQDFQEMEYTAEIGAALDIYSDETCAQDDKGRVLHIYSDNERVKEKLEELFYDTLNVEFNLRSWARNLVKYGDFFLYNDVSPEHGVLNAFPIPVNEIEREENYDKEDPFAVRYRWVSLGNRTLENWEITHFRLLGNDMFLPYGSSILESARRIWRQLILIEDAMMVYRVVRAPERRVFYIDVAGIPAENVPMYVEEQRKNLRTNQVVDRTSGRVDLRYNPLSVDEDYIIPVRGGESGTKIDTLAGGQNTAAVEDVAYIQKKLFAALKIPRAYLGYDEMLSCFVPETQVALLDGRTLSIEQMKGELDEGKQIWVYSVDPETKEMKPGRVVWAGPTRENAALVRVTIDNGESFDCTPDHKWMLRDGTWCEAGKLTSGQSLMPLYRRNRSLNGGSEYEQVYDVSTEKWHWTHRLVHTRSMDGERDLSRNVETRLTIHHKDFDRFNNNPVNLVEIGWNAHRKLHQDVLSETRQKALIEGKYKGLNNGWARKCRENVVHLWSTQSLITWCQQNNPSSKRQIISGYGLSETQLHALLSENSMTYAEFARQYVCGGYKLARSGSKGFSFPNYKRVKGKGHGARGAKFEVRECLTCKEHFQYNVKLAKKFCSSTCRYAFGNKNIPPTKVIRQGMLNHSVVSVVPLAEHRQTWCIEVAGTHTFGLANGTIVSNSKATLAQEDIRFSRTINVIQKTMIAELNKLAIIHLFACGFQSDELLNYTLRMSNPSTIAQQQKLELWRTKLEIGGSVPEGYLDRDYVRKEIWGLNDDECRQIDKQRMKDKLVDIAIEGATTEEGEGAGAGEEGGGGMDLFGDTGGDGGEEAPAGGEEELPPEENAGDEPEEETEPDTELLTSSDDSDDDESFSLKLSGDIDVKVPVKAQKQLDRALYNRGRLRTHGASKTHLPDFRKMTSDHQTSDDPYDNDWFKAASSNPLGEVQQAPRSRMGLPRDVSSALANFSARFGYKTNVPVTSAVLTESAYDEINVTIDDEDDDNGLNEGVFIVDDEDDL